jgi:hypothetical protein
MVFGFSLTKIPETYTVRDTYKIMLIGPSASKLADFICKTAHLLYPNIQEPKPKVRESNKKKSRTEAIVDPRDLRPAPAPPQICYFLMPPAIYNKAKRNPPPAAAADGADSQPLPGRRGRAKSIDSMSSKLSSVWGSLKSTPNMKEEGICIKVVIRALVSLSEIFPTWESLQDFRQTCFVFLTDWNEEHVDKEVVRRKEEILQWHKFIERILRIKIDTPPNVVPLVNIEKRKEATQVRKPRLSKQSILSAEDIHDIISLGRATSSNPGGASCALTSVPSYASLGSSRTSPDTDDSYTEALPDVTMAFINDLRRDFPLVPGERRYYIACFEEEDSVVSWVISLICIMSNRECKVERVDQHQPREERVNSTMSDSANCCTLL